MRPLKSFFKACFVIMLIGAGLPAQGQKIDLAPLDAYWRMVEPLRRGDSLSTASWEAFLALDPNQTYVQNQGFDAKYLEALRRNIQYVYMPRYDSLLQARVAKIEQDPAFYWLTYKVYVYRKNEDSLRHYAGQLTGSNYINAAYANAWAWLPREKRRKDTSVTLHFLGIENDAIAGAGTVIATLWSAYNQDRIKRGILAGHELHHVLRGGGVDPRNAAPEDEGLLYFLNAVLNEGSADMIDKPQMLAHEKELPMEFRFGDFLLFQADSILRQVDTAISVLAQSGGKIYKSEKDYRKLIRWTSGHCPGYYMADVIVRNGLRDDLLAHIRNPFYFIALYNRAAKRDAARPPLFSQQSLGYIRKMEQRYWKGRRL